jgi:hypothetical protein
VVASLKDDSALVLRTDMVSKVLGAVLMDMGCEITEKPEMEGAPDRKPLE